VKRRRREIADREMQGREGGASKRGRAAREEESETGCRLQSKDLLALSRADARALSCRFSCQLNTNELFSSSFPG
jgi:hypothetical protein